MTAVIIGVTRTRGRIPPWRYARSLGKLRVGAWLARCPGWWRGPRRRRRTWAVEGAGGLGYLLSQQLVAPGERVVDVQANLAARVRLLGRGG